MLHVPTKCDVFLLQTDASGVGLEVFLVYAGKEKKYQLPSIPGR